jgi:hypothetical protein
MKKEDLISNILDLEWEMFSNVRNRDGRASCQEDPQTFRIIRSAGFMVWSEDTLESYLADLGEARDAGRNLMTEKYARMEGLIDVLNPDALLLITEIVSKECSWAEEFRQRYPHARMGRPIRDSEAPPSVVSAETYSRAELETYSMRTLALYRRDNREIEARGQNRIEMAALNMSKRFSEAQDVESGR